MEILIADLIIIKTYFNQKPYTGKLHAILHYQPSFESPYIWEEIRAYEHNYSSNYPVYFNIF